MFFAVPLEAHPIDIDLAGERIYERQVDTLDEFYDRCLFWVFVCSLYLQVILAIFEPSSLLILTSEVQRADPVSVRHVILVGETAGHLGVVTRIHDLFHQFDLAWQIVSGRLNHIVRVNFNQLLLEYLEFQ